MPINDGSIIVGIKGDTSDIEQKISELQRKLRSLRETGPGGSISQLAQQYRNTGQEDRAKRLEDFRQRVNTQNRQAINRSLRDQESSLNKMMKQYQAIDSLINKQLVGGRAKIKVLERQAELMDQIKQKSDVLNQAAAQGLLPGGVGGQPPIGLLGQIAAGGRGLLQKAGNFITRGGAAIGAVAGSAMEMADIYDFMNRRRPGYQAQRTVSLAEEMYAPRRRAMEGRSYEDIAFAMEKQGAMSSAMDFYQRQAGYNRGMNLAKGVGGTAAIGIGALSLLAAPFTGGLSLAGGLAAAGGIAGGTALLTSGGGLGYEALYGNMGEVDKMTGQQAMEYFRQQEARRKSQAPVETMFKEYIGKNRERLLNLRRTSGMRESDFMRQYVQGYGLEGAEEFTTGRRFGMTQDILGAGGSVADAFGGAGILALQAQRSYGMTNAGQVMGRLSGYMGAGESQDAFRRLMTSAVADGFDTSKKMEDYLGAVSSIAYQMGGGEEMVAASIAAAVGADFSRRDIQMAAESFGQFDQIFSEKGGPTAAARAQFVMESDLFKGLTNAERLGIQQMKHGEFHKDNPKAKYAYEQYRKNAGENAKDFDEWAAEVRTGWRKSVTKAYEGTAIGKEAIQAMEDGDIGKAMILAPMLVQQLQDMGFKKQEQFINVTRTQEEFDKAKLDPKQMAADKQRYLRLKERREGGRPVAELSEQEEKEFQALSKKAYIRMGETPEGFLEGGEAVIGKKEARELRGKTREGKDIVQVMDEMGKNMGEIFKTSLETQLNFENFNKALESGATEAMGVFKDVIRQIAEKEDYFDPEGTRTGNKLYTPIDNPKKQKKKKEKTSKGSNG